jgi:hypothetical protein
VLPCSAAVVWRCWSIVVTIWSRWTIVLGGSVGTNDLLKSI